MTVRLTASGFERATRCTYWLRPDVRWPDTPPSDAARRGTALHDCIEHGGIRANGPVFDLPEKDQDLVAEWYARWQESPWASVWWRHEVPMAWSRETGSFEISGRGRQAYTLAPHAEFAGTADLIGTAVSFGESFPWIADVKTGHQVRSLDAAASRQLRMLAAMWFDISGARSIRVELLGVSSDGVASSQHVYHRSDLLPAVEHEIEAVLDAAPSSVPTPGEHCHYCPAEAVCPAKQKNAEKVTALAKDLVTLKITKDNAPTLLARAREAGKFAEEVERAAVKALKDAGVERSTDPETGVEAYLVDSEVPAIDLTNPDVRAVLDAFTTDDGKQRASDAIVVTEKLTWAALEKMLPGKRKTIQTALAGVGGIKYAPRPSWKTREPK